MTLREILDKLKNQINLPLTIQYRITLPKDFDRQYELLGYCEWDGKRLISLDQDMYSLDDEIISYKLHETESEEKILIVMLEGIGL